MNELQTAIVQNELNLRAMKTNSGKRGATQEELQSIANDLEALLNQLQNREKL